MWLSVARYLQYDNSYIHTLTNKSHNNENNQKFNGEQGR